MKERQIGVRKLEGYASIRDNQRVRVDTGHVSQKQMMDTKEKFVYTSRIYSLLLSFHVYNVTERERGFVSELINTQ